jgi:hypothetical protein
MERHEIKALVDGRMAAGKKSLDAMKARLDSEEEEYDAKYRESVEQLQKDHDEMRHRAARLLEEFSGDVDTAGKDLERSLGDWEARAKQASGDQHK